MEGGDLLFMYTVYMLHCRGGALYTGIARDLAKRLAEHRAGKGSKYVRSRLPVRVVLTESARTLSAALKREAAIKRMSRAFKRQLVRGLRMERSS